MNIHTCVKHKYVQRAAKVMRSKFFKTVPKYTLHIRIFLISISLLPIFFTTIDSLGGYPSDVSAYASVSVSGDEITGTSGNDAVSNEIPKPKLKEIELAKQRKREEIARKRVEAERREYERKQKELEKVNRLRDYLASYGSPMAPYAKQILDSCMKYGKHYCKYFLSIAGVESGFGRIPIGCCNAWGWGSTSPSSWEVSISYHSDEIANRYFLRGFNTFEKLAYSSYHGGDAAARNGWIRKLYSYYNQIPI